MTKNNPAQILASSPEISAWVSASAGTGKTKILTSRVLRLLLNGVAPEKILCLTFTKAAAKEMDNRINDSLSSWSKCSNEDLKEDLNNILGRQAKSEEVEFAPKLFSMKINAVSPIKIQTIHSFCQFILDKFPVEAGVAPGFKVIDEFKSSEIISKIRIDIISNLHVHEQDLKESIEFIAGNLHDIRMTALIEEIVLARSKFQDLFKRYSSGREYYDYLSTGYSVKISSIRSKFKKFRPIDISTAEGNDLAKLEEYNRLLLTFDSDENQFQDFLNIFLTSELEPRKTVVSKKWSQNNEESYKELLEIQEILLDSIELERSNNLAIYSSNLFTLAKYILQDYEYYKKIYGYLDYDDLIAKARDLLIDSSAKEWVLYKLDGGINHILLDEAQDTSEEQWEIIQAITSEFYSGLTKSEENRTLFIVGDEKQSIYSFQGADPESYKDMNKYFASAMQAAGKIYQNIELGISYRSTAEITEFVSQVFSNAQNFPNPRIEAYRSNEIGKVEIWPITFKESVASESWPLPIFLENESASEALAKKIADYVCATLSSNRVLKSKNREINSGDFLILVRRRTEFVNSLIKNLKSLGVKVAGIDRMSIMQNIAILDIISMAKFVLMPEDDLNLACFLKSPFIELIEPELFELCVNRGGESLYCSILAENQDLARKLVFFQDVYLKTSISEFFMDILEVHKFRNKLLSYHSAETNDVINEFLQLVFDFEKNEQNSLQHFIFWLENSKIEIKRDLESSDSLRVMTVHGAKGLQAPIVIVADTTTAPISRSMFLWNEDQDLLWSGNAKNYNREYKTLLDLKKKKEYEEYLRLLYVALTRAEDELVICGYAESRIDEGSWYNIVQTCDRSR